MELQILHKCILSTSRVQEDDQTHGLSIGNVNIEKMEHRGSFRKHLLKRDSSIVRVIWAGPTSSPQSSADAARLFALGTTSDDA